MKKIKQERSIKDFKMRNLKIIFTGFVCALGIVNYIFSATTGNSAFQMTLNSICVVAVTGNPSTLSVSAPATGGQTPSNPSSNSTYAQYTSALPSGQTRRISAAWGGSDSSPTGCTLKLLATPASGQGSSAGQITLSATATNIVTGIGGCATGTDPASGAQLTYTIYINSVTQLVAGETKSATVTLTLMDAS